MFPFLHSSQARIAYLIPALLVVLRGAVGQEVLYRFEGTSVIEQIGRGDQIEDLDGDGVSDLVTVEDMEVVVFRSGADGSVLYSAAPDPEYRGSLTVIDTLGDFDGDGVSDVLVGAGGALVAQSLGRVDILSGATAQKLFTLDGTIVDGLLGSSIAAVGDVDGDGYADALFIGFRGPAHLVFGPDGSRSRTHPSIGFAVSVSAVGDIDKDGLPDYGVGSPLEINPGFGNAGVLDLYSGVDGSLIRRLVGNRAQGYLGFAATSAGDFDGDGYGDVLVGLPGNWRLIGAGHGSARVYSGRDGAVLWSYKPPTDLPESFGLGMAGGRDFTGDGIVDWVVGAPVARDSNGDHPGAFYFFDGASGALIWKLYGEEPFIGRMGLHVFLADDLNGDGISDIGYGDTAADPNGVSTAGVLTVIAGAPGSVAHFCTANPNSTGRRAKIAREGPIGIGNNELTFLVSDAVPGVTGIFYYGSEARSVPFGDGIRCVGGGTQRLFPPAVVDVTGNVRRTVDFTQTPLSPGNPRPITPGSTKYFQFWYRDPAGAGSAGFNLSDGLEILFAP